MAHLIILQEATLRNYLEASNSHYGMIVEKFFQKLPKYRPKWGNAPIFACNFAPKWEENFVKLPY